VDVRWNNLHRCTSICLEQISRVAIVSSLEGLSRRLLIQGFGKR